MNQYENILRMLKSKKYLIRLLITILLLICVPLLYFQIAIINESTKAFSSANTEYVFSRMRENNSSFYEQVDMLSYIGVSITQDNAIWRAAKQDATEYDIYQAAVALNDYNRSLPSSYTLGVYFRNTGRVVSNGTAKKLSLFCDSLTDDILTRQHLDSLLNQAETGHIFSSIAYSSQENHFLILMKPVSILSATKNDAVVLFLCEHDSLQENYQQRIPNCIATALLDKDGQYLMLGEALMPLRDDPEFSTFLKNEKESVFQTKSFPGVSVFKYATSDGIFLAAFEDDILGVNLRNYAETIRVTLYVSLTVFFIMLMFSLYWSYKPIAELLERHSKKEDRVSLSEMEVIDSLLFEADQKLIDHRNLLEETIISDLLYGKPSSQELIDRYFPKKANASCVVFTFQCRVLTTVESLQICNQLKTDMGYQAYITSLGTQPASVLVVLSKDNIDMLPLLKTIQEVLNRIVGEPYKIGKGTVVSDISELRDSYLKAQIDEYRMIGDEDNEDMSHEMSDAIKNYAEALAALNKEASFLALDNISQIMGLESSKAQNRKYGQYYLYRVLATYLMATRRRYLTDEDVTLLLHFRSRHDLFDKLHRSMENVFSIVESAEHLASEKMKTELLAYVEKNLTNGNLSLTSTADHLEISIYAVSRLFKEVTGQGFKEYVTDKRLERAHHLLITTSEPIAKIATLVGFDTPTYFSTVFKTKYGASPRAVRSNHMS